MTNSYLDGGNLYSRLISDIRKTVSIICKEYKIDDLTGIICINSCDNKNSGELLMKVFPYNRNTPLKNIPTECCQEYFKIINKNRPYSVFFHYDHFKKYYNSLNHYFIDLQGDVVINNFENYDWNGMLKRVENSKENQKKLKLINLLDLFYFKENVNNVIAIPLSFFSTPTILLIVDNIFLENVNDFIIRVILRTRSTINTYMYRRLISNLREHMELDIDRVATVKELQKIFIKEIAKLILPIEYSIDNSTINYISWPKPQRSNILSFQLNDRIKFNLTSYHLPGNSSNWIHNDPFYNAAQKRAISMLRDIYSLMQELWMRTELVKENLLTASISRIINRNYSHHIGSHVSPRSKFNDIYFRIMGEALNNISSDDCSLISSIAEMENKLTRYKDERNDFIAGIQDNVHPVTTKFYQDVILPFIENSLLMDNLAKSEEVCWEEEMNKSVKDGGKSKLRIRVFIKKGDTSEISKSPCAGTGDGEEESPNFTEICSKYTEINGYNREVAVSDLPYLKKLKNGKGIFYGKRYLSSDDIEVSVPGSLGAHSIYSLLENIIRNTAKHAEKDVLKKAKTLDVNIRIKEPDDEDEKYDFYDVEIDTNIRTISSEDKFTSLKKKLTEKLDENCKSLGFADMKINATLLKFEKITQGNLNKNITLENKESILSYKIQLCKPHKIVFIGDEFQAREDKKNEGIWYFKNADDCINSQKNRKRTFQFAVISPKVFKNFYCSDNGTNRQIDELLQHLPWRVLVPCSPDKDNSCLQVLSQQRRVACISDDAPFLNTDAEALFATCWEKWVNTRWGGGPFQLVFYFNDEKIEAAFQGNGWGIPENKKPKIILNTSCSNSKEENYRYIFYDRHGTTGIKTYQNSHGVFFFNNADFFLKHSWMGIEKNNLDFDIINSSKFSNKEQYLASMAQWVESGLHRILIVDERALEVAYSEIRNDQWGYSIQRKKSYIWQAAVGQVFIASSFSISSKMKEERIKEYLSDKQDISFSISTEAISISFKLQSGKQLKLSEFDTLIIHRTMFDKIYQDSKFDTYWGLLDKTFPNIIIDTGGGKIDYQSKVMNRVRKISYLSLYKLLLNGNLAKKCLTNYF